MKDVVAALIREKGKILITKRKTGDTFGGFWEFPGGKVESAEKPEGALRREIKEELDIYVEVGRPLYSVETDVRDIKLKICLYECKMSGGEPKAIECSEIAWVWPDQLRRYEFIPVDKKIVQWVEERYGEEY